MGFLVQCQKPAMNEKRVRRDLSGQDQEYQNTKQKDSSRMITKEAWQSNDNDDMLFEVFKHLDSKSLAIASCVSRRWKFAAEEEKLWEGICTQHWPFLNGSQSAQLRSVVLALGGFHRLYVHCLRPLLSRQFDSHRLHVPSSTRPSDKHLNTREWSKDEVHLSLSLFSIDCYERLGRRSCCPTSLKFLRKPTCQKQPKSNFPLEKSTASSDSLRSAREFHDGHAIGFFMWPGGYNPNSAPLVLSVRVCFVGSGVHFRY
eukprot:Gb_01942 [translate_table: standard]